LADTANEYRPLGAVIKPRKRNPIGRRTADWRHCRAGIRSDLSECVKAIGGNRCDEKQTPNLDHEFLLLHFVGERDICNGRAKNASLTPANVQYLANAVIEQSGQIAAR
jgi:hypothetical protein